MRHTQNCFPQHRTTVSVARFQTAFWHDIKHSEMSTLIEDGSGPVENMISIFSPFPQTSTRCCVVTKRFLQSAGKNLIPQSESLLSCQRRQWDSPPNLWQQGVFDVFWRFLQNDVWIFVFIYPGDKFQVLWYRCVRSLCHDQVQVSVSCMSECCIACETVRP